MSDAPEQILKEPGRFLDDVQTKWLDPPGWPTTLLHRLLVAGTTGFIRLAYRLTVEGRQHLPTGTPVIFAPNHESSLDAPLLIAALPASTLRQTYWAVRQGRVLANPLTRMFSRLAHAIPIERDVSALAAGAAVLSHKHNLVWFPEGTRTRDGQLQEFKFGIGALAHQFNVSVVPVAIEGAFEAWPPEARFPRLFSKVAVRFGKPLSPDEMQVQQEAEPYQQLADEVRQRVEQLTDST